MSKLIDGEKLAAPLCNAIAERLAPLRQRQGITPGLAVVLVGGDSASECYVRKKQVRAEAIGMNSFVHRLADSVNNRALLTLIEQLNHDPQVHGILIQLPLPPQIDTARVIQAIHPDKDVDGFHPLNAGLMATHGNALIPCTPLGCLMLLEHHHGDLSGQRAVVLGRSNIVGKPMAHLLLRQHCTVTIAHSRTQDLAALCRQADILVAAVGRPRLVTGGWIKPGATVIDVGINRVESDERTRLVGDVDFATASEVAGAITPVPGGVGPMTIACLMLNTLRATCRQHGIPLPDDIATS
ncbi:bifunctional methylenetetrahydrofolate dehydrogenase/methenyltetrahydrofolate cyclohydrolase FolD [Halomonas faecis]|uniref:bifunctional methylenetetrahydrofolate dehydrogenase/methenyltetrahydrofolate cyclohydrolase FolD n=1 Tax=Halomonas faecis TaxID=1562110 RepID=UPI0013D5A202|nr:bifunctional methylenetetrahydrofolate dehydrogenase/methenyltetrahydrofolate cyclohydrolase FolD [Halomonas faecis]